MMEQIKGYRFRLYPTAEQIKLIKQTHGAVRYVCNLFLDYRRTLYELQQKTISKFDMFKLLTLVKNDEPDRKWLKEVDSKALQLSLDNLDRAYKNFFTKRARYPCFKSRHHHRQTYSTDSCIRIVGNKMLAVKGTAEDVCLNAGGVIGLDVGIKSFCVDSNGNSIQNPKPLRSLSKKLKTAQRHLSGKKCGSRNRDKQRLKVARIYEHIANIRLDFLHKLTTKLCRENQTIAVESLNVSGLLNKHVPDAVTKTPP